MANSLVVHKMRAQYDVYVGRPTKWGNPFTVEQYGRGQALERFRDWVRQPQQRELRNQARQELRGKTLACWCAPQPCHAEVWVEISLEPLEVNGQ